MASRSIRVPPNEWCFLSNPFERWPSEDRWRSTIEIERCEKDNDERGTGDYDDVVQPL